MRSKIPNLPPRLEGLAALATNLSWSWNREARALFRQLDLPLWRATRHNPVEVLRRMDPSLLTQVAEDREFVARYDAVMEWMAHDLRSKDVWFRRRHPDVAERTIAYFCAEFGLHTSVPIYSGGLGVLAGDHCKACSDLGIPLIGVGLSYMKGYFDQRLRADGWQEDSDDHIDPESTPMDPVPGPGGAEHVAEVDTFGRSVRIRAWRLRAGRVPLYLLDTDLEENHPDDRALLSRLYAGGPDLRLRQEWILGTGGVRVLRAVGAAPAVWHANEGHAAFMMLERVREHVAEGLSFEEAVVRVRATTVFTTHTPVPAGHDTFDPTDVVHCTGPIWEALGIEREDMFRLARHPTRETTRFHMSVLALSLAGRVNGVAQRHGQVSRSLWSDLWPDREEGAVPIGAVTNGVHLATWMSNEMMALFDRALGSNWGHRQEDPALWDQLRTLDAKDLWEVHLALKQHLMAFIREEARRRFADQWKEATQVVGAGTLLDPNALTIGFARRFATYKRANLIFRDVERLHRLLVDPRRPVQIVVAGKAHPADTPGKEVLQEVFGFTHDPFFEGRVAFLEDYEMHLAHVLVQGVDLWLNLPRVPLEASGTSGMKAALNGVPQLGTVDGWWEEGFDGTNGWSIPRAPVDDPEAADEADAEHLYRILEDEIVPLYYARDQHGVPVQWVDRMRNALRVAGSRFTARRMVQDYVEQYYVPAMRGEIHADDPPTTG